MCPVKYVCLACKRSWTASNRRYGMCPFCNSRLIEHTVPEE